MFQRLEDVEKRYDELTEKISDPEEIAKTSSWQKLMKEHSELTPIVEKYREYKKAEKTIEENEELLKDPELKELAQMEIDEARESLPKIEEELKILLIPKDPDDDKI